MFKKLFENKKGVIFDLDGTVADTNPLWFDAVGKVLKLHDCTFIDISSYFLPGKGLKNMWGEIIDAFPDEIKSTPDTLAKETDSMFMQVLESSDLSAKKGFFTLASELKNRRKFKLGLVTNTSGVVATAVLKKIGALEVFDVILTKESVRNPKPDPSIYKQALSKLGLNHKQVIAIEDSISGATSAARAALPLIIIYEEVEPTQDYPGKIHAFVPDFTAIFQNIDLDAKEMGLSSFKYYYEIGAGVRDKLDPKKIFKSLRS
jgi:beta-phosphoglucomutase-like phosphatase (HAD superfamily)